MRDFFRPGFWDILGTALGVLGLGLGGSLVIKIAPDSIHFILILGCFLATLVGGYCFKTYLYTRNFPFGRVEHSIRLVFRKVSSPAIAVRATLERMTSFSPRSAVLDKFDRYQLVPNNSESSVEQTLLGLNHTYSVRAQRGAIFQRRWHTIKAVSLIPVFDEFSTLRLNFKFKQQLKGFAKRFEVKENMTLPNDFSAPTEFYEVEITEPARKRDFEFVFEDMKIYAARYIIKHGAKIGTPKEVMVSRSKTLPNHYVFRACLKNLTVGSKIRFEWDWHGA